MMVCLEDKKMLSANCPCCSNTLLRHIRSREIYWFCIHCHQEMPNYSALSSTLKVNTNLRSESRFNKSSAAARNALNSSYMLSIGTP